MAFVAIQTVFEGFGANTPEKAWACAKRYDLAIPFAHEGKEGEPPRTFRDYKAMGTPWTVVIDARGIVRADGFHIAPDAASRLIETLRAEARSAAQKEEAE